MISKQKSQLLVKQLEPMPRAGAPGRGGGAGAWGPRGVWGGGCLPFLKGPWRGVTPTAPQLVGLRYVLLK